MRSWFKSGLPGILLLLAPLALLSPVLLRGEALFWGTPALQFTPWRELAWESLRAGSLPLWNPGSGMGAPLFANYQSALAYPPTWLLFLLSSLGGVEWSAWGQGVLVVLHWIIAAAGMARLAGGLGLGRLAQALSGLAFGLGGYLVSRAGFLSINATIAWLPWLVHYAGQVASPALRRGEPWLRAWLKLGLVCGLLLLAGHAQTAWYACLLAVLWGGYWGWLDRVSASGVGEPGERRGSSGLRIADFAKGLFYLGLGLAFGAALAAIQLVPTLEYLAQSQRAAEIDFEYAMTYSFWPWRFLTLLAPDLFGSPVSGDYWGYANYWEDALYLGLLPLLLALSALVGWLFKRPAYCKGGEPSGGEAGKLSPRLEAIPFLLVLMVVSFVLALGKNTPLFPWLYRHVPTFDMFQAPTRFAVWASFALALLAGFGAQVWRRPTRRALYWTRLGTAGAVAVMIGAGLAWYLMGEVSPTFIRATALAGLWGVGAGVLSLLAPPSDENGASPPGEVRAEVTAWHWAVVVFVSADLILAGWGLNPGIDPAFYSTPPPAAAAVTEQLAGRRLYLSTTDEQALKFERFLRFDSFDPGEDWSGMRAVFLPNLNLLDGIPMLNNFDPLIPGRYETWMEALSSAQGKVLANMLDISGAGGIEALGTEALGTEALDPEGLDSQTASGVGFESLPGDTGMRARWVACAIPASSGEAALGAILEGSFDPQQAIVVAGMGSNDRFVCPAEPGEGDVELVAEAADRLVYRLSADSAGWLLLADTWYPGWQAFVDGEGQPIYRANYLFRAVPVGAGEHELVFTYRPTSFWSGAIISLLAWAFLALVGLRFKRRYRLKCQGEKTNCLP
jgi:hypothetical protein